MSKHDYYKELDKRITNLPSNDDLDALGPLKAVDASPKELAKLLFEIAPEEFGCLENAEMAMEAAVQKAKREMLANTRTNTRH